MAYDNQRGVSYSRWTPDIDEENHDEPETDQSDAVLDELYFESYSGDLNVTVETDDGYLSLKIPVTARIDWDKFVNSLPQWDDE